MSSRKLVYLTPTIPTHGSALDVNGSLYKVAAQYKLIYKVTSICPILMDCSIGFYEGKKYKEWRLPKCDIISNEHGFIGCKWVNGIILTPNDIIFPHLNFFRITWRDIYNTEYNISWEDHIIIHKLDDKIHGVPRGDKPHYDSESIGSIFTSIGHSFISWLIRIIILILSIGVIYFILKMILKKICKSKNNSSTTVKYSKSDDKIYINTSLNQLNKHQQKKH